MFCNMCGANIPDGVEFCPNCGAPQPKAPQENAPQAPVQPEAPAQPEAPVQAEAPAQPEAPVQPEVPAQTAEPEQISAASTTPMMDIPIAEATDEMDPESGTTVLTFDMSGPLTSESKPGGFEDASKVTENSFNPQPAQQVQLDKPAQPEPQAAQPEEHKHQLQTPEGKVSTPAPVTGSSILSDENVAPVTPTVQAQQYQAPGSMQQNMQQNMQQSNQNFNQQYVPTGNNTSSMSYSSMGEDTAPLSTMAFLGWTLLYNCVPIVGLIFMFINAFGSNKNVNLKNFSRANLIILAIVVVIELIAWFIIAATGAAIMSGLDFIML